MKNAYLYIRFSTAEQAVGDSTRRQQALAESYCAGHGLKLQDTATDTATDRGRSAYHGKHREKGALGGLLKRLKRGDVLLMEDNDRWSREAALTALTGLWQAVNNDVEVHFMRTGIVVTKENFDDISVIVPNFFGSLLANQESKKKGERVKASWVARRAALRSGQLALASGKLVRFRLPAWLAWPTGAGKPVLIEDKAATVRRIFTLAASGHGILAIARLLNAERVAPITTSAKHPQWCLTSLRRILRGKEAIGFYCPRQGEPVKGCYPAVVSEAEYYAALARLGDVKNIRARVSSVANLFTGLLHCRKCGHAMTAGSGYHGQWLKAICQGARSGRTDCKFKGIPLALLEKCVFELLSDDLMGQLFKTETPDKLAELQGKLAGITAQITRAAETVGLLDGPPPQQLADKINGLQAEQKAITAEIEAERAATAAPVFEAWQELVRGQEYRDKLADPAARGELRRALHGILERVDCDPERKGNHWQAKLVLKGGPWCELELRRGGQWRLLATSDALKEAA